MAEGRRAELVWSGKYDEDGNRRSVDLPRLPFQIVERVNESRATRRNERERGLSLFEVWNEAGEGPDATWRNKIVWGENGLVMSSLRDQYAGKINLIYIDPPFATGLDFSFKAEIGEEAIAVDKEQSIIEEKAYRDTWGGGIASYLDVMAPRLELMRELLADDGSLYVHLDATVGHYVKVLLDEIFGPKCFQREIIWRIGWVSGYKSATKNWIRNHDMILFYVKTPGQFIFNKKYVPYPAGYKRRGGTEPTGKGYPMEDVWNANESEFALTGAESLDSIQIKSFSTEKTGYPTQKNESLLKRIIEVSSNEGDLVADFFCGSGTTAVAAEHLGRRWIAGDLGRFAVHVTRKRLMEVDKCGPFDILNLGRYERQYWHVATFGEDLDDDGAVSLHEYIAFILKLYGATPAPGLSWLHGRRGDAFIQVGAVDAPITIAEAMGAVQEAKAIHANEVHLLGWEWEMGLNDLVPEAARDAGVSLALKQIPREVMEADAGSRDDIRFFELAYLEAAVEKAEAGGFRVELRDFIIADTDLVPDALRDQITKWSDYIDYWAVDWNFSNDTFMQAWVTYRTRRDRSLELVSDDHIYEEPGEYQVMVKVVDVFGNDTSRIIRVSAK